MIALQIIFWLSVFAIAWTYFGYFLFLKLAALFYSKNVAQKEYYPRVSHIITAYNEEKLIGNKIENCLTATYPRDKLKIIIASDGSTDNTESIIRSYGSQGVHLMANASRRGKHYCQGQAIAIADGEILVFSDATTFLKEDAISRITRNFADQNVGCVSGKDMTRDSGSGSAGEDAYVRYEMKLRTLESLIGNLVGVSGCFFAIRKSLCGTWFPNLSSDFYLPILTHMNGYRVVLEPAAIAYYDVLDEPEREFHRKVRTVVNGMAVLKKLRPILNPFKYGAFALQMISHKIMRWWVPVFLLLALFSGAVLGRHLPLYWYLSLAQIAFYSAALIAFMIKGLRQFTVFRIPLFFVVVNMSILLAWHRFLTGSRFITWESTKR